MRIEAFAAIPDQLIANLHCPGAAQGLAELLVRDAGAAACRVWLCCPGDRCRVCPLADECRDRSQCLHLAGKAGSGIGPQDDLERVPIGARIVGQVASSRAPFVCHQSARDRPCGDGAALAAARIQCCTVWPLVCDNQAIGVLALHSHEEMTDADLQQAASLARRSAQVLSGARVVESLRDYSQRLEKHNELLAREVLSARQFEQILGSSFRTRELRERIEFLAGRDEPLLICGPAGSGKELAARALHAHGPRRNQPFVRIDSRGAMEGHLAEELFGREAGIGARGSACSILELAAGGTLFLRHVDQLPRMVQERLVEACRSGLARRAGSESAYPVRVRLIGSMLQASASGPLVEYLARSTLSVAGLSDRSEDIPLLIEQNVRRFAGLHGRPVLMLDEVDRARLQAYSWPGNVRELIHVAERAVLLSVDGRLRFDLPEADGKQGCAAGAEATRIEDVERAHIIRVLRRTQGVIQGPDGAAALLGLSPSTLRSRMARLGISRHVS